jgi:hypothetical protein
MGYSRPRRYGLAFDFNLACHWNESYHDRLGVWPITSGTIDLNRESKPPAQIEGTRQDAQKLGPMALGGP